MSYCPDVVAHEYKDYLIGHDLPESNETLFDLPVVIWRKDDRNCIGDTHVVFPHNTPSVKCTMISNHRNILRGITNAIPIILRQ